MADHTPVFTGQIDERGRIVLEQPVNYGRWLQRLAGQRVELIVRKRRAQRSDRQNRAYFGIVVAMLAEHCGYEPDEMHEALAWKFLGIDQAGDPLPRRRSTAGLTTAEFEDYVGRVRRWAAEELGCDIPEPNEVAA